MKNVFRVLMLACFALLMSSGCRDRSNPNEVYIYCAVDEPYASKVFLEFEKQTGIHVHPTYDIESAKSVGLSQKLEAEKDHPQADVWWGSEAFNTARLVPENVLIPYASPNAADIPPAYKDKDGMWAGVGLRSRVIAVGVPAPGFELKQVSDLLDPRLKGKICISRPTAGATGAHVAALYLTLGQDKADAFFKGLHDNGVTLLGGNAEVADQVGTGGYQVGITDSDDVTNTLANGGHLSMVIPDQGPDDVGAVTMPTTVGLVAGAHNPETAKKLIDFLESRATEQNLIDQGFAKWSVRARQESGGVKSMPINYDDSARIYAITGRRATALMEGRPVE